ncbi:hypothetical protein [Mucilaginibacter jinjuensis]|uniref:Uncharacterized protein n=1 Tax=Mucilaginibacter jinjuensis TaxID=1176721 RepID=A0ABY7T5S7_9SPHI|nr:hypothetical protein [Mucilaginibacter jinjuensis]WCT11138.1 hypothetical protein PQO05_20570 [Mucilaginibacter jinjuensis]
MEKRKGLIWRIILIAIIYSLLSHWDDVKRGFIDGLNDGHTTAMNTRSAK